MWVGCAAEGPVVFRRGSKYYVLSGTGCCACIGGSTIYVQMADSMHGNAPTHGL